MPSDTINFGLDGDITLHTFRQAMAHLDELVAGLAAELGPAEVVEWTVERLEAGSAFATVRGTSENMNLVDDVVRGYHQTLSAIRNNAPIPFGPAVQKSARRIRNIVGGKVIRVHFGTDYGEADIEAPALWEQGSPYQESFGLAEGIVDTIVRKSIRFVILDSWFGRPVSCYASRGQEESLRRIWGKHVQVEGRITRDRESGRAVSVREISRIDEISRPDLEKFQSARGVLPVMAMEPPPEERLRRLRDAE